MFQQAASDPEAGTDWAKAFVDALPAIIAFIGIVVSLIVNQWFSGRRWESERQERVKVWDEERDERRQAAEQEREDQSRAREHEHELERNRVLRADRLALYRRLVDAAGDVLTRTTDALGVPSDNERHQAALESNAQWASALAVSRLLAAEAVYDAAVAVEIQRKDWLMERNREASGPVIEKLLGQGAPAAAEPQRDPRDSKESMGEFFVKWWKESSARTAQAEKLIAELVDACKADVRQLRA